MWSSRGGPEAFERPVGLCGIVSQQSGLLKMKLQASWALSMQTALAATV